MAEGESSEAAIVTSNFDCSYSKIAICRSGFSDLEVMQALSSQVTSLFHVSGCRLEREKWDNYSSWFLDIQTAFQEKQNEIIPQEKNYKNLVSSDVRMALRDELEITLKGYVEEYKNDEDEEEPLFPERIE